MTSTVYGMACLLSKYAPKGGTYKIIPRRISQDMVEQLFAFFRNVSKDKSLKVINAEPAFCKALCTAATSGCKSNSGRVHELPLEVRKVNLGKRKREESSPSSQSSSSSSSSSSLS